MTGNSGLLAPYRVLDLADEKGLFCGKLLGDMGADVVKIERPGGDAARRIGPFVHDEANPDRSLYWFARNTNKRSITLDIEKAEGHDIFGALVKTADFVIESSPPGYMESLGLGYSSLEAINPGVIMVSISPFGQTGPYRDYKAPDIVSWAMGGYMFPWENADHPPVRVSHHSQAYLHASGEGAAGAMMALYHRNMTGEGQHVDVSIHESIVQAAFLLLVSWDLNGALWNRSTQGKPAASLPRMWPCKDGYVIFLFYGGERAADRNLPLVQWMEEAGMGDDSLREFDWLSLDMTAITEEAAGIIEEPTRRFFLAHTKAELMEGSLKHGLMLYPVSDTADLAESAQLRARGFWVDVEHPELGTSITYPGAFGLSSEISPGISRRPPLIGEHNGQILQQELGLPKSELDSLRKAGVI